MKAKATIWCISIIFAATVLLTFIQPTVIHQLVVWVSGLFAMLVTLGLFVVSNWPVQQQQAKPVDSGDEETINAVATMRACNYGDATIAAVTGIDIDVIKAIPR